MEDFNDCFNELDKLTVNENIEKDNNCCSIIDNFICKEGITSCKVCNKLISNITENPEWRFYGSNDSKSSDPTRCGMPVNILLPNSSVGTVISNQYSKDKSMYQVKKYTYWSSMTYKERSMYKVFTDIQEIAKKNNLPPIIIQEAKSLYKIISDIQISRGNNRKGIIAACVYFACKDVAPRSAKEIASMFNITTPVMTKGTKTFQEILQSSKIYKKRILNTECINADDFVHRFCNKLKLNDTDVNEIKKITKSINKINLISEIRPDSIAAGSILLYAKKKSLPITKKDISDICKISEVTINKCCKKLEESNIFKN